MPDDLSDIMDYYTRDLEHEHTRLDHHQLEYDLTWRYLERYLPAQGSLLEIGAATGRYTVELARRGYQVTAVDMNPALLERCRASLKKAGLESQVCLLVADAAPACRCACWDIRFAVDHGSALPPGAGG